MAESLKKDPKKVADRLRGLCSRREYSSSDIMKKAMNALDGDAAESEKIVSMLIEEGYVDDRRYASAFARDKSSIAGWGSVKIRYMLSSKGISKDVIGEALQEIDDAKAVARLDKIIANKAGSLKDDPRKRLKLLRFALGRGYGYDEVKDVLDRLNED